MPQGRPAYFGVRAGIVLRSKTDIVVIGAGQAGLSSAYHLKKRGLAPGRGFVVLDRSPQPGRRLAVPLALA